MGRRGQSGNPFSLFAFLDIITSVMGIMILVILLMGLELVQRTENSPAQKTAEITSEMESAAAKVVAEIAALERQLRDRRQEVLDVAAVNPTDLARELKELEELNRRLQLEASAADRQSAAASARRKEAEDELARRKNDPRTVEDLLAETKRLEDELRRLKESNRVIFNPAAGNTKQPWLVELSNRGYTVAAVGKTERPSKFADLNAFRDWLAKRDAGAEYFVLLIKPSGVRAFPQTTALLQQMKFDVGYDLLIESQTAIDPEKGAGTK